MAVRRPRLWRLFRPLVRKQFNRLAPVWADMRSEDSFRPLEAALDGLSASPRRVLDLGTGTGAAAFLLAARFPKAEVVGVDIATEMLAQARALTPPELAERVRFEPGDGASLPYDDASFELVVLANVIPFFDELARVTAPGGTVIFSFSGGAETPIYVPSGRLRRGLEPRGFTEFADFSAGRGTSLLARKRT